MNILVTGAHGFLGSYLLPALHRQGHRVTAYVRQSQKISELESIPYEIISGDICDLNRLRSVFSEISNIDAVFHLAAKMSMHRHDHALLQAVNVEGTRNIVNLCHEFAVPKLIYASSAVTIGASFQENQILHELSENPIRHEPLVNYQTKIQAEELVLSAAKAGKINAVVLNPSLIFGARDAQKTIRQGVIRIAKGKVSHFTSGGVNVIGVEEVVDGFLQALEKGKNGERYLLTGENLSTLEFMNLIARSAGVKGPETKIPTWLLKAVGVGAEILHLPGALNKETIEIALLSHCYDNSKARRELGFKPGSAKEAIEKSVQWILKNEI